MRSHTLRLGDWQTANEELVPIQAGCVGVGKSQGLKENRFPQTTEKGQRAVIGAQGQQAKPAVGTAITGGRPEPRTNRQTAKAQSHS